jgi:hypothetical protein
MGAFEGFFGVRPMATKLYPMSGFFRCQWSRAGSKINCYHYPELRKTVLQNQVIKPNLHSHESRIPGPKRIDSLHSHYTKQTCMWLVTRSPILQVPKEVPLQNSHVAYLMWGPRGLWDPPELHSHGSQIPDPKRINCPHSH